MSDVSTADLAVIGQEGALELAASLEAMAERVIDISPVLDAIHWSFLTTESHRFDLEGPGWAPLAPSTLEQKQRKGYPDTILEATGALRASLTEEDAAGSVWEPLLGPAAGGAVMGTDLKPAGARGKWAGTALAAFHQSGTDRMPARPVIDDVDTQAVAWSEILTDWLMAGVVTEV